MPRNQCAIFIRELNKTDEKYISAIANLHKKAFPGFFLTQLGKAFLQALYTGYLEDVDSGIFVAEEKGILIGFVAYSMNYPKFYKELIRNHVVKFMLCSVGAVLRHPSFAKRLFGALRKSDDVTKPELYVELASICVSPTMNGHGIGTALVDYLKHRVDFSKYAFVNLETDADGNEAVNHFYQKNGFRLALQYVTKEGRRMNEYRYAPSWVERSAMT